MYRTAMAIVPHLLPQQQGPTLLILNIVFLIPVEMSLFVIPREYLQELQMAAIVFVLFRVAILQIQFVLAVQRPFLLSTIQCK